MLKAQNISNVIDYTKVNIINNLHSTIKQTTRPIHLSLKQNKKNYVLTHLNVLIAKEIIKQIPISVPSGSIASIGNGTLQNTRKSGKIGPNQSA